MAFSVKCVALDCIGPLLRAEMHSDANSLVSVRQSLTPVCLLLAASRRSPSSVLVPHVPGSVRLEVLVKSVIVLIVRLRMSRMIQRVASYARAARVLCSCSQADFNFGVPVK